MTKKCLWSTCVRNVFCEVFWNNPLFVVMNCLRQSVWSVLQVARGCSARAFDLLYPSLDPIFSERRPLYQAILCQQKMETYGILLNRILMIAYKIKTISYASFFLLW